MRIHVVVVLALVIAVGIRPILAQDTTHDRTQTVDSFALLSSALRVGQDVTVRQGAGRTTRGRVASVSDQQLVIATSGWFRRQRQETFAESGVTSIDLADSKWDGAALGALAAIGVVGVMVEAQCRHQSCNDEFGKAGRWVLGSMPFSVIGFGIGAMVDAARARSVFVRRAQSSRVAIAPWFGRDKRAVLAHVRF